MGTSDPLGILTYGPLKQLLRYCLKLYIVEGAILRFLLCRYTKGSFFVRVEAAGRGFRDSGCGTASHPSKF